MATSTSWKDKTTGEKRESTQWHNIVIFNEGLVSIVEKFVNKGSKILVEGQIQTRKWQDREGADKFITEIVLQGYAGTVVLLDSKEKPNEQQNDDYGDRPQSTVASANCEDDLDDEIPF